MTNNKSNQSFPSEYLMGESARNNLVNEQATREKMLDELLKNVRKLTRKYLCLLNTDEEGMAFEFLGDDICRLMLDEHMNHEKALSIVNSAGAILVGVNDELHDYQEYALK